MPASPPLHPLPSRRTLQTGGRVVPSPAGCTMDRQPPTDTMLHDAYADAQSLKLALTDPDQASSVERDLRWVRPDAHQLLAEIGALEQPHERAGRAVQPFGDELAIPDLALAHPLRHVAQEIGMTRGEIADDEAPDRQALGQHRAHHR